MLLRFGGSDLITRPNATFGSLLIANPVSSPPPGMYVRATNNLHTLKRVVPVEKSTSYLDMHSNPCLDEYS